MSTQVGQGTCPVCGSAVNVMGDHEGTMHYQPVGQFNDRELELLAHGLAALTNHPCLLTITAQTDRQTAGLEVARLHGKVLQLAFMEVSRDA